MKGYHFEKWRHYGAKTATIMEITVIMPEINHSLPFAVKQFKKMVAVDDTKLKSTKVCLWGQFVS